MKPKGAHTCGVVDWYWNHERQWWCCRPCDQAQVRRDSAEYRRQRGRQESTTPPPGGGVVLCLCHRGTRFTAETYRLVHLSEEEEP